MMNINELQNLLNEFNELPKDINESTYLDLCQYPTRRFEEICSRLLSFYFLPNNEHKFSDLLLKSLLQTLPDTDHFQYSLGKIKVIQEENAEGKRIDIVIVGDNFVIGIENKITAALYNPLDIYRKKLDKYKKNLTIGIVLSIHPIQKESEKKLLHENNFINILYSQLFLKIKQNFGFYINQCNNKYLIFLEDIIMTIENIENNNILNSNLLDFFYENSSKLDELYDLYSKFKERIAKIQIQNLQSLKETMSSKTSYNWQIWEDWDLVCEVNNIFIEANFESSNKNKNPLGKFKILITTKNLSDDNPLASKFPDKRYEIKGNKVYVDFDTLINPEIPLIEDRLMDAFNRIKE